MEEALARLRNEMGAEVCLDHVPCKNGGHTSFILLRAPGSSEVTIFAEENYALVTEEVKRLIRETLAKAGYELVESA